MTAIIAAALELGVGVLSYINTENARKLINDVKDIKLQILEEEGKGYDSDDAKLETLYKKATILLEAAQSELALHAK